LIDQSLLIDNQNLQYLSDEKETYDSYR